MSSKNSHRIVATWIFGASAFAILAWIVLFGPDELSPTRHTALGVISGILCGCFGYFLTGSVKLVSEGKFSNWGKIGIQAGGGVALFLFVLLWWRSSNAPISRSVDHSIRDLQGDVEHIFSYLELQDEIRNAEGTYRIDRRELRKVGFLKTSKYAKELAEKIPDDSSQYALALKAIAQERYPVARTLLDQVIEGSRMGVSEWGSVLLARAYLEFYAGRVDWARPFLDKARGYGVDSDNDVSDLSFGYYSLGDYLVSKEILEDFLKNKKSTNIEPKLYVQVLSRLALANLGAEMHKEAEHRTLEALAFARSSFGSQSIVFAEVQSILVSIYIENGDYSGARNLAERNCEILRSSLGVKHEKYVASEEQLALCLVQLELFTEALDKIEEALDTYQMLFGEINLRVAYAYSNRGTIYMIQRRLDDAYDSIQKSISISRIILGDMHPRLMVIYGNLALVCEAMGNLEKGIELQIKALEIEEYVYGENHREVATSLNTLGLLYESKGDFKAARRRHERSLGIRRRIFGPNDVKVAMSLNNLGSVSSSLGQFEDAKKFYEESLRIYEKNSSVKNLEVSAVLSNLSRACLAIGNLTEAELRARQSLKRIEKAPFDYALEVAIAKEALAHAIVPQGKFKEAERLYREVIDIRILKLGRDDRVVAEAKAGLATLFARQGMYIEAEGLYLEAHEITKKFRGPRHLDVGRSAYDLGYLYENWKVFDKAKNYYESALSIYAEFGQLEHPVAFQCRLGIERIHAD